MSIGVKVKNGNLEKALSQLKRKVKDSNMWVEWKEKQYYTKPSKKRRTARHKAEQREKSRAKEEFAWDPNSKYYNPR